MPLQTLFGWPEAPDPSPLVELGLLVGLPVVVIVIAFAVAKAGAMARVARTGGGVQASDPIWLGGQARSIMSGPEHVPQRESRELEAAPRRSVGTGEHGTDSPGTDEGDRGTGGASARW